MSSVKLTRIDRNNSADHTYIQEEDKCHFLFEYTKGLKRGLSKANDLIYDLKFTPHPPEVREKAIETCSSALAQNLPPMLLKVATLVPVPPSKIKSHVKYDNRMLKVCHGIDTNVGFKTDSRELVTQIKNSSYSYRSKPRLSIDSRANLYTINEDLSSPTPTAIGIIDDMLVTGGHFKAMQKVLRHRFPKAIIFGIFITRRAIERRATISDS